jgi:hypothetical protein
MPENTGSHDVENNTNNDKNLKRTAQKRMFENAYIGGYKWYWEHKAAVYLGRRYVHIIMYIEIKILFGLTKYEKVGRPN